jgi:hypothetical protein
MPRPKFTLRTLLILMFSAACFFGGMAVQKKLDRRPQPTSVYVIGKGSLTIERTDTRRPTVP